MITIAIEYPASRVESPTGEAGVARVVLEMFDLSGRVALVTGGSRGLGRAMVDALAAAGADVVIASRNLESCEKAAAEVSAATGRAALPYGVHVGRWDQLDGLVDAAYDRFGKVDVLVNNAGMSPLYDSVDTVTEELFDKVMGVNLKGPFRLAALVGTRMAAAGSGSIINISSAGAVRPRPEIIPYAAAKAGLNSMTVGLAHAFGPTVRVNAIQAGTFLTDVSRSWDADAFAVRAQRFALRRGGEPVEIVGAALYLASDAASYTTGAILTVDGGQP
jgi:NAD(P)-dependent dehydrogenase (short-subunit alcohol dehydrogenase family)